MYVCVCNAIKSSEIEALAKAGVSRAEQVYSSLQVETNCENCVTYVQEALDEYLDGGDASLLRAADATA